MYYLFEIGRLRIITEQEVEFFHHNRHIGHNRTFKGDANVNFVPIVVENHPI
jgi:hypothetical protein